jgi:hypothetical protein
VTDALLELVILAERRDIAFDARLNDIRAPHPDHESVLKPGAAAYIAELKSDCRDIPILQTVKRIR